MLSSDCPRENELDNTARCQWQSKIPRIMWKVKNLKLLLQSARLHTSQTIAEKLSTIPI